jgi:AraC-like DNA-binding protein
MGAAVTSRPGAGDWAHYFRPKSLPGVEVLHATFVTHRYGAHLHRAWTVAAVDSGAASFNLESGHHTAGAGSIFLIPPHAMHTGEPASPAGYRYRVVYLDPGACSGGLPDPLTSRPRRRLPVVVRNEQLRAQLARLHGSLALPGSSLEQGEMLAAVVRELAGLVRDGQGTELALPHPGVLRALEYIHANWRLDFTFSDLAAAAQISPFHLIRIFRGHVGVTPSIYRRALRVRAARDLLTRGWSPADAAAECGFFDQSHLNRHFKLVSGVTPRQYQLSD